jgi:hypothetical protein
MALWTESTGLSSRGLRSQLNEDCPIPDLRQRLKRKGVRSYWYLQSRYWKPPGVAPGSPGVLSRVMGLNYNHRSSVPRVQDLDSSPRAICRACGWSHSLDGRQSSYSHVSASTVTGSSHDHGASRYDKRHDRSWDVPALFEKLIRCSKYDKVLANFLL